MKKSTNIISRIIVGVVIMVLSFWFVLFAGFIDGPKTDYFAIILGAFFFLIGLFVVFNKDEDKIEKIKN